MVDFVDLNRKFLVIGKNEQPILDIGRTWGQKIDGWLNWSNLLKCRRVVLLAEASSGKTEEFIHQAEKLVALGKSAFFVRIEDLADDGFEAALEKAAVATFEKWCSKDNEEDGWFFLDAVDEARLNHKSLDKALRRFEREIGKGLERAHVFTSCRVSDWKGREDRLAVERLLPVWKRPAKLERVDEDEALLEPIFNKRHQTSSAHPKDEPEPELEELLIVQLVPLNAMQRRDLAEAAGVKQPDEFVRNIEMQGLDALADRPGDLLDLAEYWEDKGRFGSLSQMTEHAVALKLIERDKFRPDNKDLSYEKARHGAERLAAALTLAKSFTLRAPGFDTDPSLAAGAIDPVEILDDWNDAERNALMRKGVFAPSTYGRVRFHQRGTQEYLMASWLKRLLDTGCPLTEVWNLLFADLYGVETLVPSLHAPAAWLAHHCAEIREEIIRREPLALLRDGDPHSLPLGAKERLLLIYASRHAVGDISNASLDYRSLWMFATPNLSNAIREAWGLNDRVDFRIDLLCLIREGAIKKCADLARGEVLDVKADEELRVVALEALETCGDRKGLSAASQWISRNAGLASNHLAAAFAKNLFPKYLTVDQLLEIIRNVMPPYECETRGFSAAIVSLWDACPDSQQERFIEEIANLVLSTPFLDSYNRISARYHWLAAEFYSIANKAVSILKDIENSDAFLRLLMAIERVERKQPLEKDEQSLKELVSRNPRLKQRLFWADVEENRQNAVKGDGAPKRIWHIWLHGRVLWELGLSDIGWLSQDISESKFVVTDKQVAFSAICSILGEAGRLEAEMVNLHQLAMKTTELEKDLEEYLKPRVDPEEKYREKQEESSKKRDKDEQLTRKTWIKFRDEIKADPSILHDASRLASWTGGAYRIYNLSYWLAEKTQKSLRDAPLQWRLLEEVFGRSVAEAFRDGIKILWRLTVPERPVHEKDGRIQVKYTTILSFAGVCVEAMEDIDWASHLTVAEAKQAALQGCISEQGWPEWMEPLIDHHPSVVLPILRQTLLDEWNGRNKGNSHFFSHYGWHGNPIPIQASVQQILFEIINGIKPKDDMLNTGLRVLRRLDLSDDQRQKVAALALRRFRSAKIIEKEKYALHNLAILFLVDPDKATYEFYNLVSSTPETSRDALCEKALSFLFGYDSSGAIGDLQETMVASLETLLRITYQHLRLTEDMKHGKVYTPNTRDKAEDARNALLTTLYKRPGVEAYRTMRELAIDPAFTSLKIRFHELARGKAEQDSELPPWLPLEILAFERQHVGPAKTGEGLLRLVMGTLSDIQNSFRNADATSRALLKIANNEEEVQEWLAEQFNLRAKGRYHAHREAQVAQKDRPDIIISSSSAQIEVAVEVKHSGMGWSIRDLEKALKKQLVEDYLRPESRRHGVLVISHHKMRTWRDPDTKVALYFDDVINRLHLLASEIMKNKLGPVNVRVFGLDCM